MKKTTVYNITIAFLLFIIILQGAYIIRIKPKILPKVPLEVKGKIAIVIDDWGYNLNNLPILVRIKYPITCSILPNLNYSYRIAKELDRLGFEIILHLPMEPHEKSRLEEDTIMATSDEQTIKNVIAGDLANIVYVKGVSNHMGSRLTEDSRAMEIIFGELKKRNLYFLDSVVSSKSVCFDLARKMGLRFAERDVFLDNQTDSGYIKGQIYKLKLKAKIHGQAIGIGHDRKTTLEVLKETLPQLEKEGYKFVFVSELVR